MEFGSHCGSRGLFRDLRNSVFSLFLLLFLFQTGGHYHYFGSFIPESRCGSRRGSDHVRGTICRELVSGVTPLEGRLTGGESLDRGLSYSLWGFYFISLSRSVPGILRSSRRTHTVKKLRRQHGVR